MQRIAVSAAILALVVGSVVGGGAASAATRTTGPRTSPTVGNDVSWPQCGKPLPSGQAFGIVGVNGGKASNFNSCFSAQWSWARTSKGGTSQPPAQLYVNTGNPGDVLAQYNVADWPTSSIAADPHGGCSGTWTDSLACSWEYGNERASADIAFVGSGGGTWWLDIETSNSWTSDPAKNQASLEGMVYALGQAGARVGIYSSSGSWSALFGAVASSSPLYSLGEWRPGATTLSRAASNCSLAPFEGNGRVVITQYVSTNLDYDHACP
ncbi:MAG: hypothetical protein M3N95_10635 [Actinomycetota bacterium]|nr:hypothetical protein [Actinomycetota bacterium]